MKTPTEKKKNCPICSTFQIIEKDGEKICLNCNYRNKPSAEMEVGSNWNL